MLTLTILVALLLGLTFAREATIKLIERGLELAIKGIDTVKTAVQQVLR